MQNWAHSAVANYSTISNARGGDDPTRFWLWGNRPIAPMESAPMVRNWWSGWWRDVLYLLSQESCF